MTAIGTRLLTLSIDTDDVTAEVSTCIIKTGETDSDFVSFADAAAGGGREYSLALTFVQDAATASLWDKVWTQAGEEVPVLIRPYGAAAASPTTPHFSATAIIAEPDGDLLGGEADASPSNRFTTEVEWKLTAKPLRIVA
jgi:hypothetical protein